MKQKGNIKTHDIETSTASLLSKYIWILTPLLQ